MCFEWTDIYMFLYFMKLSKMCARLDEIWSKSNGEVVLFSWVECVRESLLADALGNSSVMRLFVDNETGGDHRAMQTADDTTDLLIQIIEYDRIKGEEEFRNSYHLCPICFEEKMGGTCIYLNECEHTFCKGCLGGYLSTLIRDCNIKGLKCPDMSCRRPIAPLKLRHLLNDDEYEQFERLSAKMKLDETVGLEYCPRLHCQQPVMPDEDSNLCVCLSCFYPFCSLCKMTWHGIAPCKLSNVREILEQYENGDEEEKRALEKRYGMSAIMKEKERVLSQEWLQTNTQSCPTCRSPISKSGGCNKMHCEHCHTMFCWLCMRKLNSEEPYEHFKSGACNGRLFEGLEGLEEEEREMQEMLFIAYHDEGM